MFHDTRRPVPTFWDASYHTTASPCFATRKARAVVAAAQREGLVRLMPAGPFDEGQAWSQIARFHAPAFVEAVRSGRPRPLAESQGFTWSAAFARALVHMWEGQQRAAHYALRRTTQVLHPVSGAHRALRDRGEAACTFNFLIGAADVHVRAGRAARVCLLDYDAHRGDGTLALGRDLDFLFVHDVARGTGSEVSARIDCHSVNDPAAYRARSHDVGPLLDRWTPDLVFYLAGADPHEDDPAGIPGVDTTTLVERDAVILTALHARRIPTVVTLAGGCQEDGTTVAAHVATIREMARLRASRRP